MPKVYINEASDSTRDKVYKYLTDHNFSWRDLKLRMGTGRQLYNFLGLKSSEEPTIAYMKNLAAASRKWRLTGQGSKKYASKGIKKAKKGFMIKKSLGQRGKSQGTQLSTWARTTRAAAAKAKPEAKLIKAPIKAPIAPIKAKPIKGTRIAATQPTYISLKPLKEAGKIMKTSIGPNSTFLLLQEEVHMKPWKHMLADVPPLDEESDNATPKKQLDAARHMFTDALKELATPEAKVYAQEAADRVETWMYVYQTPFSDFGWAHWFDDDGHLKPEYREAALLEYYRFKARRMEDIGVNLMKQNRELYNESFEVKKLIYETKINLLEEREKMLIGRAGLLTIDKMKSDHCLKKAQKDLAEAQQAVLNAEEDARFHRDRFEGLLEQAANRANGPVDMNYMETVFNWEMNDNNDCSFPTFQGDSEMLSQVDHAINEEQ